MKLFMDGLSPSASSPRYSTDLIARKTMPSAAVAAMSARNRATFPPRNAAALRRIATLEAMRMTVFTVASGTFKTDDWSGHDIAQQGIGREQRSEQHHFRCQEQPHSQLLVCDARVGPHGGGVGNLHQTRALF